jgi:hypothetical protein
MYRDKQCPRCLPAPKTYPMLTNHETGYVSLMGLPKACLACGVGDRQASGDSRGGRQHQTNLSRDVLPVFHP